MEILKHYTSDQNLFFLFWNTDVRLSRVILLAITNRTTKSLLADSNLKRGRVFVGRNYSECSAGQGITLIDWETSTRLRPPPSYFRYPNKNKKQRKANVLDSFRVRKTIFAYIPFCPIISFAVSNKRKLRI